MWLMSRGTVGASAGDIRASGFRTRILRITLQHQGPEYDLRVV